jgi:hypothetical protein
MSGSPEITAGRENGRARPKGYAPWRPHRKTRLLLEQVEGVIDEYADHLPLTVRQIFYRLVGQYGYEKTELAYNRLVEALVRARRAQMIDFNVIRDDGINTFINQSLGQINLRIAEETQNEEKRTRLNKSRKELAKAEGTVSADGTEARVKKEPMVYGPDSPNSYVNDLVRAADASYPGYAAANQRLAEWGHQVERNLLDKKEGRGRWNKHAEPQLRELAREHGDPRTAVKQARERGRASLEEKRAGITTGGGATATGTSGGAAFVNAGILRARLCALA